METNVMETNPPSKDELVKLYEFFLTQKLKDVAWWLLRELVEKRRAINFIRRKGLLSEYKTV